MLTDPPHPIPSSPAAHPAPAPYPYPHPLPLLDRRSFWPQLYAAFLLLRSRMSSPLPEPSAAEQEAWWRYEWVRQDADEGYGYSGDARYSYSYSQRQREQEQEQRRQQVGRMGGVCRGRAKWGMCSNAEAVVLRQYKREKRASSVCAVNVLGRAIRGVNCWCPRGRSGLSCTGRYCMRVAALGRAPCLPGPTSL